MLDRDLRWRWIGLCVLSVIAALFEAVGALGIFWIIGIVYSPENAAKLPIVGPLGAKLAFDGNQTWVIWCAVAVMVFYALKNAFLVFHYYLQIRLPHEAYVRVSTALLRGYLTTDYSFHFARNSAEVIRNLINSVDVVFRTVLHNVVMLVSEIMMVLALLAVLFAASPTQALLTAGVLAILAWIIFRLSQQRVTIWGRQIHTLGKDVLKVINHALGAVKEVKVTHRENYFLGQYYTLRERQAKVLSSHETFLNIPQISLEVFFVFLISGIVILVSLPGKNYAAAVPLLGLYGYAGLRLLPALARIAAKVQRVNFGSAAVDQVYTDYVRLAQIPQATVAEGAPMPFSSEIRIERVSYTYPNANRCALNQVSVVLRKGVSAAVVGPSGGGKSTLIDILLGLLVPDSGCVLVDGVDISSSPRAWQRNLGYVPQTPYLLDDTLRRNIAFGIADEDTDETALADAVRMAQLTDLVATLPKGLDTEVGEKGIRLSGGQRQRIVIARALYRRSPVLIFDEATSELDNQTEREISAAIDALAGTKTVIVIAHRMATVRNCDVILYLADGRINDIGNYDELLARNSSFAKLVLTEN